MAYLDITYRCDCAKWRKLEPEQQGSKLWQIVHHLHHTLKRGRPPFTIGLVLDRAPAGTSEAAALDVLTAATAAGWFRHVPAAAGQPGYYLSPVKPK